MSSFTIANQLIVQHPLFGLLLTLVVYQCCLFVYEKSGRLAILHPLLISAALIISVLTLSGISYFQYFESAKLLHLFLGAVTVALAIPLYESLRKLRRLFLPVLISISFSVLFSVLIVRVLAELLHVDEMLTASLLPKSVTTPIAISLSEEIGGEAALTTVFVLITGLFAPLLLPSLLKLFPAKNDAVSGIAIGISAHAIGTAKALEISRECGAFSALAMSLMGILTALFMPFMIAYL